MTFNHKKRSNLWYRDIWIMNSWSGVQSKKTMTSLRFKPANVKFTWFTIKYHLPCTDYFTRIFLTAYDVLYNSPINFRVISLDETMTWYKIGWRVSDDIPGPIWYPLVLLTRKQQRSRILTFTSTGNQGVINSSNWSTCIWLQVNAVTITIKRARYRNQLENNNINNPFLAYWYIEASCS